MSEYGLNHGFSLSESMKSTSVSPVLDAANQSYERLEELRKSAFVDSLTGVYNRSYLDDYIARFDSTRNKKPLTVVFCDVDNLGAVNKEKGDAVGDKLITDVAESIKSSVRGEDIIARKGGDEFIVIIEDFSNFEELKDILSNRFKSKQTPDTMFSFGIVQYDSDQDFSLRDTIQRGNDQMREDYPNKKIPKH